MASRLFYWQQIHNNDVACDAMDTRFKGPESRVITLNLPLRLLAAVVEEEAWLTGSGQEEAWALRMLS